MGEGRKHIREIKSKWNQDRFAVKRHQGKIEWVHTKNLFFCPNVTKGWTLAHKLGAWNELHDLNKGFSVINDEQKR